MLNSAQHVLALGFDVADLGFDAGEGFSDGPRGIGRCASGVLCSTSRNAGAGPQ
jgi:hypothetical protein